MVEKIHYTFVGYTEAQKLIPLFEHYAKEGPWKDVRFDARVILRELRDVRNIDYTPLPGQQIFLTAEQYDFLNNAREEID